MRDKARRGISHAGQSYEGLLACGTKLGGVARMRDKAMRGCSHAGQSYEGLLACGTKL